MDVDLGTGIGDRYSIITLLCALYSRFAIETDTNGGIVFVPYILTEIPGNYALKRGIQ